MKPFSNLSHEMFCNEDKIKKVKKKIRKIVSFEKFKTNLDVGSYNFMTKMTRHPGKRGSDLPWKHQIPTSCQLHSANKTEGKK